ncbi:MAG: FKBP-type peptidyl-prolyl cis-trans isomerase [Akkermansia sp.]|nr:FKBP-type peptidyl-prolyl cis-trans isomerase [Akkermansia sp.]
MKNTKHILTSLAVAALAPIAFAQTAAPAPAPGQPAVTAPAPEEIKAVFSYLMGYRFGHDMAMQASTLRVDDLDTAILVKAIQDGMLNRVDPEMESKDVNACMNAFVAELQARATAAGAANLAKGNAYLAENAKKPGVVTTASGLQYKVLTEGKGKKYDEATDGKSAVCYVVYEGRLIDGTVFDKTDTPIDMPIDRVVPGFSEALKLMPVGSEWEVVIPSNLAYGEQGPGIIGNNATLIFKLKLTDIKPARGTQANPIELTPEILQQLQEQDLQQVQPQ